MTGRPTKSRRGSDLQRSGLRLLIGELASDALERELEMSLEAQLAVAFSGRSKHEPTVLWPPADRDILG